MDSSPQYRRVFVMCAVTLMATVVGCAGSATMRAGVVYSDPVLYVDTAPTYYGVTPVYYNGYPAYWINSRWYYQSPRGWAVFQREPAYLYRYRVSAYSQPGVRVHTRVQTQRQLLVQPQRRVPDRPQPRIRAYPQARVRVHAGGYDRGRR